MISEILTHPGVGIADWGSEWFEITNISARELDLDGVEVYDLGGEFFVVSGGLPILAGEAVWLGSGAEPLGDGTAVDFDYGQTLRFSDIGDTIGIRAAGGALLDEVAFWEEIWWTPGGVSLSLDPLSLDPTANDSPASWCYGVTPAGPLGITGTPGGANPPCSAGLIAGSLAEPSDITGSGNVVLYEILCPPCFGLSDSTVGSAGLAIHAPSTESSSYLPDAIDTCAAPSSVPAIQPIDLGAEVLVQGSQAIVLAAQPQGAYSGAGLMQPGDLVTIAIPSLQTGYAGPIEMPPHPTGLGPSPVFVPASAAVPWPWGTGPIPLTWNPVGGSPTEIELSFDLYDGSGQAVEQVACRLADAGGFEVPAGVVVPPAGGAIALWFAARSVTTQSTPALGGYTEFFAMNGLAQVFAP